MYLVQRVSSGKYSELSRLWREALIIWRERSRRSRMQDMRMQSKHVYPSTSVRGLELWIRRRGIGVDITGLDAGVARNTVRYYRLVGNRVRPRGPWMSVLEKVDMDKLFSVDDMAIAKKYYEEVLGDVVRLIGENRDVRYVQPMSKDEMIEKYSDMIHEARLEKKGWIDDFRRFADLKFRAGFDYRRNDRFVPEYFLRRPKEALKALMDLGREYGGKAYVYVVMSRQGKNRRLLVAKSMGVDEFAKMLRDEVWRGMLDSYAENNGVRDMVVYPNNPQYYMVREDMVPKDVLDKLKEMLTYRYKRYDRDAHEYVTVERHVYREWKINGVKYLMVPRGMAYRVWMFLRDNGVKTGFQPYAPWIAEELRGKPLGGVVKTLRPYQLEAEAKLLEYLSMDGGAVLWAATGAGKTEVAIDLISRILPLLQKGYMGGRKKIYFLATTKDLVYQFAERCRKYGLPVGVITSEEFDIDKPVVAVTVQTLYRALQEYAKLGREEQEELRDLSDKPEEGVRLDEEKLSEDKKMRLAKDYVDSCGMVVFDEVQHVPACTVKYVILANKEALRLGLSATPWRNDEKDMEIYAAIGSIVDRKITSSELIARGFLVPPFIVMVKYIDDYIKNRVDELSWYGNQYSKVKRIVYSDPERNEFIAGVAKYLVDKGYGPVLVLVEYKDHGRALKKIMGEKGLRVEFVHGELSGKKRLKILDDARKGKLDVIIGTTLADEGLDIPNLRSLMIVRAGKSRVKTYQRIGRVIRRYPGKDRAVVVDIWDQTRYLEEHGEARLKLYRAEPLWFISVVDKDGVYGQVDKDISLPHDRLEDMVRAKYKEVVEKSYG